MKVLWINHFVPYPAKGGLLIRTSNLLTACVIAHHVDLVALIQPRLVRAYSPSLALGLERSRAALTSLVRTLYTVNIPSERSALHRLATLIRSTLTNRPYSVSWLASAAAKELIHKLLLAQDYDLIHLDTAALLPLLPMNLNVPVVVNHHNAEHHMMRRRAQQERNWLKKILFFDEARKIMHFDSNNLGKVSHNIVCSEDDKKRIEALGVEATRVSIVPNSVSVPEQSQRSPDKNKLLFVGGLNWYPNKKGIEWFLRNIWPTLAAQYKDLSLDIIGKYPSKTMILLVAGSERVRLHGYVEDIGLYYRNALAFISPIFDGGGTKLKVLDAMANAIPVIGNSLAFEGIDVTDQLNAFIANDSRSYGAAIAILSEGHMGADAGRRAQALVAEKYSAIKVGNAYSMLIQSLAQGAA